MAAAVFMMMTPAPVEGGSYIFGSDYAWSLSHDPDAISYCATYDLCDIEYVIDVDSEDDDDYRGKWAPTSHSINGVSSPHRVMLRVIWYSSILTIDLPRSSTSVVLESVGRTQVHGKNRAASRR